MRRLRTFLLILVASAAPAASHAQEANDDAVVADLVIDLGASEAHVRDQARAQIARMGAAAVPALLKALEGSNARLRIEAARALGQIGSPARGAVPALEKVTSSSDPALVDAAKAALAAIDPTKYGASGGGTALRVDDLAAALVTKDAATRLGAVRLLGEVRGAEAPRAAEVLAGLLADKDAGFRVRVLRALASLGPAAEGVASRVVDALVAGPLEVRAASLDVLAGVPEAAVTAVLAASSRLSEQQADATGAAPWLGAAVWDAAPRGLPMARAALAGDDAFLAAAAADALGAARAGDAESVEALVAATSKGSGIVRRRAALALGALGGAASETTIDPLIALLGDRASRAQTEAAEALRQVLVDLGERPARPLRTGDVQKSIDAGLRWLVLHQDEDGRLDCDGFERHDPADDRSGDAGGPENDVGVTALAALAWLRAGASPRVGADATANDVALRRALVFLASQAARDGRLVPGKVSKHWVYGHAIGTLALAEAWARTRNPLWGDTAQRALDFLAAARDPDGVWRYDVRPKDGDVSVCGWAVQAMRAGERAGLRVDRSYAPFVLRYLDAATNPATGDVAYQVNSSGKFESARTNEMARKFPASLTTAMTSSAAFQRLLLGRDPRTDPFLILGFDRIQTLPPAWDTASGRIDLYSWHFGTEAMNLLGGEPWAKWKSALKSALVAGQSDARAGSRAGSWDPADPWGPNGGRVYSTALSVLCLEIHQGNVPPLPRDATRDGRGLRAARALEAASKDPENHESVREAARAALAAVR